MSDGQNISLHLGKNSQSKIVVERVRSKEETYEDDITFAVATFRNGFSHVVVDDGCYLLINGNQITPYIDSEALEVLKKLPQRPKDCYESFEREDGKPEQAEQISIGINNHSTN